MINIDKYRIADDITEYHIVSKFILLRIIISKFIMIRQLFNVKMYVNMKKINMFKVDVQLFGQHYKVKLKMPELSRLKCT